LLLHGSKRNEILTLAEIEQYELDSFADGTAGAFACSAAPRLSVLGMS